MFVINLIRQHSNRILMYLIIRIRRNVFCEILNHVKLVVESKKNQEYKASNNSKNILIIRLW
jgi:hypothetical protein